MIWQAVTSAAMVGAAIAALVAFRVARRSNTREIVLQQTTQSLDTFFNISRDLFCMAGFNGHFTRVNPEWTRTLGWTTEELCAGPFLYFVHPDDRAATEQQSAALVSGRSVISFENRYRCRDGSYRWLHWNAKAQGDVIYASARDVTDQRQTMALLNEANRALRLRGLELERANRELEAFSYSVSHDLRAPLRAIDGFSLALEEDCSAVLDEPGRVLLARVRAAANRMSTLIDALLNLARLTRMEPAREPVDLTQLVKSVAEERAQRTPDRLVDLVVAGHLRTAGDPRMIRIVFENLIDNAWKYTGKVARPCVEVGRTGHNGTSAFFIRDNGAGFDMANAGKLFGAFQRLHAPRDFDGIGIGLATVQRIVHRHGGRIWAESAVNAGATFYVTFEPAQEHSDDEENDSAR